MRHARNHQVKVKGPSIAMLLARLTIDNTNVYFIGTQDIMSQGYNYTMGWDEADESPSVTRVEGIYELTWSDKKNCYFQGEGLDLPGP